MTAIVNGKKYPSKKDLKQSITEGNHVWIDDPSMFNPRSFFSNELKNGEKVIVTNHPKRSYFAEIGRNSKGNLYVK